MSTLERGIAIAAQAHATQKDKADQPYILHPIRVMMHMTTLQERIVAILHDVVEDTVWTLARLREEGFSENILAAIDALTRQQGEEYEAFVARAARNPLARRVKIADLQDNLDTTRLKSPGPKDQVRLEKYQRALEYIHALPPLPE